MRSSRRALFAAAPSVGAGRGERHPDGRTLRHFAGLISRPELVASFSTCTAKDYPLSRN
jgi:hypothetical protein